MLFAARAREGARLFAFPPSQGGRGKRKELSRTRSKKRKRKKREIFRRAVPGEVARKKHATDERGGGGKGASCLGKKEESVKIRIFNEFTEGTIILLQRGGKEMWSAFGREKKHLIALDRKQQRIGLAPLKGEREEGP